MTIFLMGNEIFVGGGRLEAENTLFQLLRKETAGRNLEDKEEKNVT